MLLKKMWRTMGLYKAQFISMIIMIALGAGVFVGFNMEWVSISENTEHFFEQTGFADYQIISQDGFSKDDLKKVEDTSGVEAASRYICVTADVKQKPGDAVSLSVTENENVSGIYLVSGEKYDANSNDGIWLSDKYALKNDISLGDELTLSYKGLEFSGKVKGLIKSGEHMICVRDESQLMPDFETFGFAYISPEMYKSVSGLEYYPQINVISESDKKTFTSKMDQALGTTAMILTKNENISYSGAQGETEEGQTMGTVLPALFLLIAVLTMATTMHRISAKEKTQIGTLKALGFKDRRILCHYTSYALMIGILGSALGVILGYGIAWMIMNPNGMMGTYMDIPVWKLYFPWFCYVVLAAILVLLTLIGFLSVKQMLKGTAADALRPYSPKKVKPMLIEKTALFHKLSFGVRWNLRDIMRHKSRTAMSLLGISGAMILIVGSLGMSDTMDAFLKMYYNDATNYSSRIYIAQDVSDDKRISLAEKYSGDWSASVSVQLEEKAVSLDVYSISHDMVRFPERESEKFIKLENNGAYICSRIADEFKLKKGDTFIVKPFGSDEEYALKVAGVIRSVSENISISKEYAESLGIKYSVDSVYTHTEKADIESDSAIKNVQSKQMIIDSFDSFTELMNLMIYILIVGALALGVVVLYNLGIMSYTERYREMATLKVVGFKDKRIGKLLIQQNLWLSVVGIIIGIPLAFCVLDYLLKALASEYEMRMHISIASILISVALTIGMSMFVSLMVARKNKKIDMVEALKGAE